MSRRRLRSCNGPLALRYNANWNRQDSPKGPNVDDISAEEGYDAADARLDRALGRLEASVRSLNGRVRAHARIEADTQKLMAERGRLAAELDREAARAKRLDDSAAEVSRRLVAAMETVRSVIAK
jgi:hypothetical protein